MTPLVPSTTPSLLGPVTQSHFGSMVTYDSVPFDRLAYSASARLYSPIETSDSRSPDGGGHRFLAWKVEDEAARVPTLSEVRPEVVKAWKLAKARPLAEAEARKLKAAVEAEGSGAKNSGRGGQAARDLHRAANEVGRCPRRPDEF